MIIIYSNSVFINLPLLALIFINLPTIVLLVLRFVNLYQGFYYVYRIMHKYSIPIYYDCVWSENTYHFWLFLVNKYLLGFAIDNKI